MYGIMDKKALTEAGIITKFITSAGKGPSWYLPFAEASKKFLSAFDKHNDATWFHRLIRFNKEYFTKIYYSKPLRSHSKSNFWCQGGSFEMLDAQAKQQSRVSHVDYVCLSGCK